MSLSSFTISILLLATAISCSSTPKTAPEPAWIHQSTRTVDSGYIVYVGNAQDVSPDRAVFKAESMAMADLANECSFIPKGARIEDRYTETMGNAAYAYAKLGITFEECEEAKKAVDPASIRRLANAAMTDQLKRYQDQFYIAQAEPPPGQLPDYPGATPPPSYNGGVRVAYVQTFPEYYLVRQQVVYEKQTVILAPAGAYAPGSPQSAQFATNMQPRVMQVQQFESANPTLRTASTGWSSAQSSAQIQNSGIAHMRSMSQPMGAMRSNGNPANTSRPSSNPRRRQRRRW